MNTNEAVREAVYWVVSQSVRKALGRDVALFQGVPKGTFRVVNHATYSAVLDAGFHDPLHPSLRNFLAAVAGAV